MNDTTAKACQEIMADSAKRLARVIDNIVSGKGDIEDLRELERIQFSLQHGQRIKDQ